MGNSALSEAEGTAIGDMLARWRKQRRLSQLDLALTAGISAKHLSFLETGRSRPSRDMVLALATALDVPLRQQNALLLAAGFAPAWRESDLAAPELAQVNHALDHMLAQQEPFPALVVDRRWNLLRANAGAVRLTAFLLGAAPEGPVNLAEAMVSPDGLRPYIVDWQAAALHLIRGVQADALADGTAETAALLKRLLAYPGVPSLSSLPPVQPMPEPVLIVEFRKGDTALRLFTTIATLGTPHDVTLQEIRIECFFPADAATRQVFLDWAAAAA
ncbi:MAG TPA: helix-turn-helix transcriptional regulator [Candidatus Sulfotelmatobacter sp.]|nr:helix-turn-helix transcriptional regulator [Candidatus Sulfotelmatobacter sp.]